MTEPKSDTEFEEQFKTELSQGNSVRVSFDGTNQIGDKSFLYRFLKDKSRVANYDEFIEQIHKLDNKKGREGLALVFEDKLVEHQRITVQKELPSGNVIEPTTVVLVIVVT